MIFLKNLVMFLKNVAHTMLGVALEKGMHGGVLESRPDSRDKFGIDRILAAARWHLENSGRRDSDCFGANQSREAAVQELPESKAFCSKDPMLSVVFNCDNFAHSVYNYRTEPPTAKSTIFF